MNSREYVKWLRSHCSDEQKKYFDAVIDGAECFDEVDWSLSKKYASEYGLQAKQCYYNAQKLATILPEARYFEGWATSIIPIEHAWIVVNGNVVDPTWTNFREHVEYDGDVDYYGIEFDTKKIFKSWAENNAAEPLMSSFYRELYELQTNG